MRLAVRLSFGLAGVEDGVSVERYHKVRPNIRFLNRKGVDSIEIYLQLTKVKTFASGLQSWQSIVLKRRRMSGRPSIFDETVSKVEENMCENQQITLDGLCILILEVFWNTLHRILTENLEFWKAYARWVRRKTTNFYDLILPVNLFAAMKTKRITWAFHFISDTKQQSHEWYHIFSA